MGIARVMPKHRECSAVLVEPGETTVDSTDPKRPGMVFPDGANPRVAYLRGAHSLAEINEAVAQGIVAAESAVRADPNSACVIDIQRAYGIGGQGMLIGILMSKMSRRPGPRVEYIKSMILGSGPNEPVGIDQQRANAVTGQRLRTLGIVPELLKFLGTSVPARHAAAVRSEPKIAVRVFGDGPNVVARKPALIAAFTAKLPYRVAVVAVQPRLSGKPHVALGILQDAADGAH